MAAFVKVATSGELAPGQAKKVEVDGKTIALFNLEGTYHAIDYTLNPARSRAPHAAKLAKAS